MPITIVTEKGFVQDISLKVERGREARSVVIKKPVLKGNNATEQKRSAGIVDIKQEAIKGIREVSGGDRRNYSFRKIDIKSLSRSREGLAYRGYKGLAERGIKVTKITEYTNRYLKIYKYEYEEKPTKLALDKITKIVTSYVFSGSLGVSERGDGIYVGYSQQQGRG